MSILFHFGNGTEHRHWSLHVVVPEIHIHSLQFQFKLRIQLY